MNIPIEEVVRKLRAENEELREHKQTLLKQNQALNDKVRQYEEQWKKETESVRSLKDLAVQVSPMKQFFSMQPLDLLPATASTGR